jgi:hypothetical protein
LGTQVFQVRIVEGVLDTLQRSPVLPQDVAGNMLKNLATLLEMADETLNLPLDLCVKVGTVDDMIRYDMTMRQPWMI